MIDFSNSRFNRRIGLLISFSGIFGVYGLWIATQFWGWSIGLILSFFVLAIISLIADYYTLRKTGIVKLARSKITNLDERQIVVVLEATRYSYYIFAASSVIGAFSFIVFHDYLTENPDLITIIDHPFSTMFIYTILIGMAFWLPSYVIAWREKQV